MTVEIDDGDYNGDDAEVLEVEALEVEMGSPRARSSTVEQHQHELAELMADPWLKELPRIEGTLGGTLDFPPALSPRSKDELGASTLRAGRSPPRPKSPPTQYSPAKFKEDSVGWKALGDPEDNVTDSNAAVIGRLEKAGLTFF